jgi:hypothetical protein
MRSAAIPAEEMTMRFSSIACVVTLAATLAGCAGVLDSPGSGGPAAEAPAFRVGDRWVYRATDGFRTPLMWDETHEVVAIAPGAITVHVTESGPNARGERDEVWATPGELRAGPVFDEETRRFTPPVRIYDFPMSPGQRWNQWVDNVNGATQKAGQINRYVSVGGWERIATPAGTFDAIAMRVLMRLDDEEFWRGPTNCNYVIYYAPAVGAMVLARKSAEYWEKSDRRDGIGAIQSQRATLELVAYTRGAT